MPDLIENAYAKINLTLDITGKRVDGYHTLRSIFQSVTLCDRISLTLLSDGKIHVSSDNPALPCGENNTVYRAAQAFFAATGTANCGVSFHLEKKIPWQAGLGGGSADAAAALRMLNRCFSAALSEKELSQIGVTIGADVPFCLLGGTALAEGIGEKLTPLPPLPHCHIVLCKPGVGVGTKEAYQEIDRHGFLSGCETEQMIAQLRRGHLAGVAKYLGNDFEKAIPLPDVLKIKQIMLQAGADGACMTGSGSTVFGLFRQEEQAQICAEHLSSRYTDVFLCEPYHPTI
ncbi:MAG: 4-diphosphocytidyl-2-C-methyl-D-erythritol kinase [Oscillospiraceae bacterium]|jgi:4-diphosphocytidyl-2-C-methyl-D-erythritol kinase